MDLPIPTSALVMLVGPSGAGKSTFAARHFSATEVVSSDECRAMVADDDDNMAATPAAFRVLHAIVRERLRSGRLTVVDATNLKQSSRRPLLAMAAKYGRPKVAIVFALPLGLCLSRIDLRKQRLVPPDAVRRQFAHLPSTLGALPTEGFIEVAVLRTPPDVDALTPVRGSK